MKQVIQLRHGHSVFEEIFNRYALADFPRFRFVRNEPQGHKGMSRPIFNGAACTSCFLVLPTWMVL